jgi:hypothetical protein
MERITRQVLNLIKEKKQKKFIKILNKNKKEVNINGFGTYKYMIKEGVNKGKIL